MQAADRPGLGGGTLTNTRKEMHFSLCYKAVVSE